MKRKKSVEEMTTHEILDQWETEIAAVSAFSDWTRRVSLACMGVSVVCAVIYFIGAPQPIQDIRQAVGYTSFALQLSVSAAFFVRDLQRKRWGRRAKKRVMALRKQYLDDVMGR